MRKFTIKAAVMAIALGGLSSAACAEGLGLEANYARANGHWGAEFGAGYQVGVGGFHLTPAAGIHVRDGATRLYGRLEAGLSLPTLLTVGAGVRFSSDDPRPYATVAMPLVPKFQVKGNLGPKYAAIGATLGF